MKTNDFSLLNLIRSKVENKPQIAAYEHDLIKENGIKATRGDFSIPANLLSTRADLTATNTSGLIGTHVETPWHDMLRPSSVALKLGATLLPFDPKNPRGNFSLTGLSSGVEAQWLADDGSTIDAPTITTGGTKLTGRLITARLPMTRHFYELTSYDNEVSLRMWLASAIGSGIDKAALNGAGNTIEPAGLLGNSDVPAVASTGTFTLTTATDMIYTVSNNNGLPPDAEQGWALTPGLLKYGLKTPKFSGSSFTLIDDENDLMVSRPVFATNHMPSNLGVGTNQHSVLFGNWSDLVVAELSAMEILVDPFRRSLEGVVELIVFQLVDITPVRPLSFVKCNDVIL